MKTAKKAVLEAASTESTPIVDFTKESLSVYGSYVVEERAVPDYRDGFKPSHRAIVWSMHCLNLRNSNKHMKAARVIGEALGRFHPHGDCLAGDTLVYLLNGQYRTLESLVGEGPKWVLAYDALTDTYKPAKAHSWRIGQYATKTYEIELSDGSVIEATGNHPFYNPKRGWVRAEHIRKGFTLEGVHRDSLALDLEVISVEIREHTEPKPMYDFTVDKYENLCIAYPDKTGNKTLVVAHNSGTYGAMVTLANTTVPVVDGQGNWGSPVAGAAAYRYTEARMSKFTDMFILNREYLPVVPYVDNYSGTEKYPLYLPALLPFLLLNGGAPIPAYGVSSGNPSFTLSSLSKVVIHGLKGGKITAKLLAKHLVPNHDFGCTVITPPEYAEIMATGRGSLRYQALVNADANRVIISSFVPGALASITSCARTLQKLSELPGVKRAYSQQGKKTKGSGPYGACFVLETKKLTASEQSTLVEQVEKLVTSSVAVRLGVTVRHTDKPNAFHYLNFVQFFQAWFNYRINLEKTLLNQQIEDIKQKIHVHEVYLWAVDNLDALLTALKDILKQKDPTAALAKKFKLPIEDADILMKRQVIQLARLERASITKQLTAFKQLLKQYKAGLKNPGMYAAKKLQKLLTEYNKKPDIAKSAV